MVDEKTQGGLGGGGILGGIRKRKVEKLIKSQVKRKKWCLGKGGRGMKQREKRKVIVNTPPKNLTGKTEGKEFLGPKKKSKDF